MKNKLQRTTALFLIMVMVLNFGSFADAATPKTVLNVLEITEVPPVVGEEISVPVTIAPNSGMTSFSVSINYSKDSLEYLGASPGAVIAQIDGEFKGEVGKISSTVSGNFSKKITEGGELFVLNFKLKPGSNAETPRLTKSVKISLSNVSLNSDDSKITVSVDPGSIAIATPIPLESITLDPSDASIFTGDRLALTYSYHPENTVDTGLSFKSANDGIASVDADGIVTGISPGKTKITATSRVGNKKATANITVNPVAIESLTLNKDSDIFAIGDRKQLETICEPAAAVIDSITWESENRNIAKVSDTGLVTALSPGKTVITATVISDDESFTQNFFAIVPEGIALNKKSGVLSPDGIKTEQLEASFVSTSIPDLPVPSLVWESSNPEIASVDETGLVTAGASGEATITATSIEGNFKDFYQVTVFPDLLLNETEGTLFKDETKELKAAYAPSKLKDSAEPSLTWSSSDTEIATVDNGLVTAKNFGDVIITAHDSVGNVSADFYLKVALPLEKITLDKSSGTLSAGASETLKVSYFPEMTNVDRSVKWSSSNHPIATVKDGIVTGVSAGSAKIIATVGEATATYEVIVTSPEGTVGTRKARASFFRSAMPMAVAAAADERPLQEIVLSNSALGNNNGTGVLPKDKSATLNVTFKPADTTDSKNLSWSSEYLQTVTVDQSGNVKAIVAGQAKITAKTATPTTIEGSYMIYVPEDFIVKHGTIETSSILDVKKSLNLTASYKTDNVDCPSPMSVNWESDKTAIATVDSDGKVTGVSPGTAIIKATTGNNLFSDTYEINVKAPLNDITVDNGTTGSTQSILLIDGTELKSTEKIRVNYDPKDTTDDTATPTDIKTTFKSSNQMIATVDSSTGVVTPCKVGKTIINTTVFKASSNQTFSKDYPIFVSEGIHLNKESGNLNINGIKTEQLTVKYAPNAVSELQSLVPLVTWTTSNPNVATVNENGLVTAVGLGEAADITATVKFDGTPAKEVKKTYKASVIAPLTGLTIESEALKASEGVLITEGSADLIAKSISETSDSLESITWKSLNPEIVTVASASSTDLKESRATVTAQNYGTTTIRATFPKTSTTKETFADYRVYVPNGINLNESFAELILSDKDKNTQQLTARYTPEDLTQIPAIEWTSSDSKIATVDKTSGLVTAIALGEAEITATSKFGNFSKNCHIKVTAPLKNIAITSPTLDIPESNEHILPFEKSAANTAELSIAYDPTDTTDSRMVQWKSENESIIKITENSDPSTTTDFKAKATVTAKSKGGKTKITATSSVAGVKPTTYEIYVPTGIALKNNKESGTLTLSAGKPEQLEAVYLPNIKDAPKPAVTWDSSDPLIAVVDEETGLVEARDFGDTIITATSDISNFKVSYRLKVIEPITNISISSDTIIDRPETNYHLLALGDLAELNVNYEPELTPDNKKIEWTSSSSSSTENITFVPPATSTDIATATNLSTNAIIKAVNSGDAKITATLASTSGSLKKIKADYNIYIPDGLIITGASGDLSLNSTKQLAARFSPISIPITVSPEVTWESLNDSIVSVDNETGLLTALSYGDTIIIARSIIGETTLIKAYPVSVTEPLKGIEINSDSLDKTNPLLPIGHSAELTVTHTPLITTDDKSKIEWKSSNEAIASISPEAVATNTNLAVKAKVTGVSGGKVTITATAHSTGLPARTYATYDVYVPSGLALNKDSGMLTLGGTTTEQLTANFTPKIKGFPSPPEITWTSNNPKIASVDEKGLVTAVELGKTSIVASCILDNKTYTATYDVDVAVPMTGIALDKTAGTISANPMASNTDLFTTEQLTIIYTPEDTTDSKIATWKSSNTKIATVGTDGLVTGIAPGKATITATVGKFKASYEATVVMPPTSISLNKSSGTLNMTGNITEQLSVNFNPTNAGTDQTITWSTSDPKVASVADGLVTAVSTGMATITASVGKLTATYQLTVSATLTKIELNKEIGTLGLGTSEPLSISYTPEITTDSKMVTWKSGNEKIATVSPQGLVTGVGLGDTFITATVGSLKATYQLNVNIPLTAIDMNAVTGYLVIGEADTEQLSVRFNPENTTDSKTITWSSSAPTIATVSSRGLVTGIASGTATITATVGAHTTDYIATVILPLRGIALDKSSGSLILGSEVISEQLNLIFTPEGSGAGKNVSWVSSDPSVGTVSGTGLVSAVSPGTTTITVAVENFSATYDLTVKPEGSTPGGGSTTPPTGETTKPPTTGNSGNNASGNPNAAAKPNATGNAATTNSTKNVSLTVKVLNSDGKTPMPGLKIELRSDPQYATSDANGFFTFTSVPLGKHTLTVSDASNKELASREINVVSGTENKANNDTGEIMIKEGTNEVTITITIKDGKIILNGDVTEGNLTPAKASLFSSSVNPKTGQEMATASMISLLLIALMLAIVLFVNKKVRN